MWNELYRDFVIGLMPCMINTYIYIYIHILDNDIYIYIYIYIYYTISKCTCICIYNIYIYIYITHIYIIIIIIFDIMPDFLFGNKMYLIQGAFVLTKAVAFFQLPSFGCCKIDWL